MWSARRGQRVPKWLGVIVLAWGLPFATVLPASPGWALPFIGGLLVIGDHGDTDRAQGRPSSFQNTILWSLGP